MTKVFLNSEFADDNFKFVENGRKFSKKVENNTLGKCNSIPRHGIWLWKDRKFSR